MLKYLYIYKFDPYKNRGIKKITTYIFDFTMKC